MASRALHLRHAGPSTRGSRQRLSAVPRHRGDDPLLVLLRRERRAVRDAARRARTRSSPTSSTTPRSSTASGCARRSGCATRNRDMADLEAAAAGGVGRAPHADRDRRRVLDGRLPRAARRDLRPRRAVRRDGHGRRLARGRLRRRDRRGHAGAARRAGPRRRRHRHARQGARRRVRRLHRAAAPRSSSCCASARVRTCSRTRSRRRSSPARSPRSTWSRDGSDAARAALRANTARFRERMTDGGLRPRCPASTRSCR